MDVEFRRDCDGSWKAPLPLKKHRHNLPNNKPQAVKRATILTNSPRKNDTERQHFTELIEKIFNKGHADPTEPLEVKQKCWYLPLFWVYHPKKTKYEECLTWHIPERHLTSGTGSGEQSFGHTTSLLQGNGCLCWRHTAHVLLF